MDIYDQLVRPFHPDRVKWRVGATNREKTKGIALAYIDARDVMKRLDDVVGAANWQSRYPTIEGGLVICELGIRTRTDATTDSWVWKANGAGETDYEGQKGSCSDAFKRAAVLWGIGRYLYALPNTWVPVEQKGKSVVLPSGSVATLKMSFPKWATPEGFDAIIAQRSE